MRLIRIGLAASVMAGAAMLSAAASAQQAPVRGVDAMGDKGRTGPDGWVQAPVTRDQAPADRGDQTANNGRGTPNAQPDPNGGQRLAPGNDPGTPVPTEARGPGALDSAAPPKP